MWLRLLPLGVFAAIVALMLAGIKLNTERDKDALPSPLVGKEVPAFSLPLLYEPDRRIDSAELRGRPFLLNVWASWCVACRVEHPLLMQLSREGVLPIVGFNWKDEPEDALRWLRQFEDPYSLILADREGRAAIDLGVYGAPETFFVDAQGVIRFKHIGPLTDEVVRREILPRLEPSP
jgi:cytochrome c biogenesis protein CcmG, thiol:disulfide interchange protein DsbE